MADPDTRTLEVRRRTAESWAVSGPVAEGTAETGALAIEDLFGGA